MLKDTTTLPRVDPPFRLKVRQRTTRSLFSPAGRFYSNLSMSDAAATARPRHVIWMTCDRIRYDHVAARGNAFMTTPAPDRLVSRGTSFDTCCVQILIRSAMRND
jgi:hypothetical protein